MRFIQAEKMARQILNKYNLSCPVNLDNLLEKHGITLVFRKLNKDEAMLWKTEKEKIIVVDDRQSIGQARFNVAHEFGHHISDHTGNLFTRIKDNLRTNKKSSKDQFADIFASELLIPTPVLKRSFHKYNNISQLARKFKVTENAMRTKLEIKNLPFNG